jgi:hypothetical protein
MTNPENRLFSTCLQVILSPCPRLVNSLIKTPKATQTPAMRIPAPVGYFFQHAVWPAIAADAAAICRNLTLFGGTDGIGSWRTRHINVADGIS